MPDNNVASTLAAALTEMAAAPVFQCPFSRKGMTPERHEAAPPSYGEIMKEVGQAAGFDPKHQRQSGDIRGYEFRERPSID